MRMMALLSGDGVLSEGFIIKFIVMLHGVLVMEQHGCYLMLGWLSTGGVVGRSGYCRGAVWCCVELR